MSVRDKVRLFEASKNTTPSKISSKNTPVKLNLQNLKQNEGNKLILDPACQPDIKEEDLLRTPKRPALETPRESSVKIPIEFKERWLFLQHPLEIGNIL